MMLRKLMLGCVCAAAAIGVSYDADAAGRRISFAECVWYSNVAWSWGYAYNYAGSSGSTESLFCPIDTAGYDASDLASVSVGFYNTTSGSENPHARLCVRGLTSSTYYCDTWEVETSSGWSSEILSGSEIDIYTASYPNWFPWVQVQLGLNDRLSGMSLGYY